MVMHSPSERRPFRSRLVRPRHCCERRDLLEPSQLVEGILWDGILQLLLAAVCNVLLGGQHEDQLAGGPLVVRVG